MEFLDNNDNKLKKGKIKIINYKQGELSLMIEGFTHPSAFEQIPISLEDIESSSIEKYSLCSGAKLKCSQGDSSSVYSVLPTKKVFLNGNPLAVISDTKPMVNIKPFGMCKSMANPTVATATAANQGNLKKMPCIPNIADSWSEGISHFLSDEQTPCNLSKVKCMYSGEISVMDVGQSMLGSSSNGSSSQSDEKENENNSSIENEIQGILYLKSKNFSGIKD